MSTQPTWFMLSAVLLAALVLSGCSGLLQPITVNGTAPTPVVSYEPAGTDNPDIFVDPSAFQTALVDALNRRDETRLRMWMTDPFLTGDWRMESSETSPENALKSLVSEQLSAQGGLVPVDNPDFKALMGGQDPLSLPRVEARVSQVFLLSGWGQDGRDEAVLFITSQPDNSIKWHGWLRVPGGFSGARLGGVQFFQSETQGFRLYAPKDAEVSQSSGDETMILGPGAGHPDVNRAAAFVMTEPANGLTAVQVVEAMKTELGPGFDITVGPTLSIEGTPALVVKGLPGQDVNRQIYMVHGDQLFRIMFVPAAKDALAYQDMEDIYALLVNTFHFTR